MNRRALQERSLRIPDRDFDISHTPVLFRRISHVVAYAELVNVIIEKSAEVAGASFAAARLAYLHVEQPVFDRGPLFRSP
jgi:hypothetical protein